MARDGIDWPFLLLLGPVDLSGGLLSSELVRAFKIQGPQKS